MMGNFRHPMMWMCVLMMVFAVVVVAAGGTAFILAPLACLAMMGMMVWMMVRH